MPHVSEWLLMSKGSFAAFPFGRHADYDQFCSSSNEPDFSSCPVLSTLTGGGILCVYHTGTAKSKVNLRAELKRPNRYL